MKFAYKIRSNLCDWVPDSWHVHPVLTSFLAARPEYKSEQGRSRPETFKCQLELLAACEGWQPVRENDQVNKNFIDGLQAVMHLNHFGINMAKVLYLATTYTTSTLHLLLYYICLCSFQIRSVTFSADATGQI